MSAGLDHFCISDDNYDAPTRSGIEESVQVLARKAGSFGTPEDIISHHMKEIERLLDALSLTR